MGYQFAHIATFSRKGNGSSRSVAEICAEAARMEGHHPHVPFPLPPTLLAGDFRPEDIPAEIDRRISEAKKAAKGRDKKNRLIIREDSHVLEAQVFSHPIYTRPAPAEHEGEDRPYMVNPDARRSYEKWRDLTIEFAFVDAEKRGLEILCIVEHLDEAHPHIHVLSVPLNEKCNAKLSHPGHAAAERRRRQAANRTFDAADSTSPALDQVPADSMPLRNRRRRGTDIRRKSGPAMRPGKRVSTEMTREKVIKQLGDRAYKAAMRGWQNGYYEQVALRAGLTRIGPARQRLTRMQWRISQQQAEAAAKLHDFVMELTHEHSALDRQLDQSRDELEKSQQEKKAADVAAMRLRLQVDRQNKQNELVIQTQAEMVKELEAKRRSAERKIAEAAVAEKRLEAAMVAVASREAQVTDLDDRLLQGEDKLHVIQGKIENKARDIALLRGSEAEVNQQLQSARDELALALQEKQALDQSRLTASEAILALAQRRQALVAESDALEEDIRRRQTELSKREVEIEVRTRASRQKAAVLDARLAGLNAWLQNQLVVSKGELKFTKECPEDTRSAVRAAASWLKDQIIPLNARLDDFVKQQVSRAIDVMIATISAWAKGTLYLRLDKDGVSEVRVQGTRAQQDDIAQATLNWGKLVDRILRVLPDFKQLVRPDGFVSPLGSKGPAPAEATTDIEQISSIMDRMRGERGR